MALKREMEGGAVSVVVMEVTSQEKYEELLNTSPLLVVHFWVEWNPPSQHMKVVFAELVKDYPKLKFIQINADILPSIGEKLGIKAVPHFVFIKNKTVIDELEGANPPELLKRVKSLNDKATDPTQKTTATVVSAEDDLNERLRKLTTYAPVMLFIKGTPTEPRCGFSKQIVEILNTAKIDYSSFNILNDNVVREGLKKFSNWPTFPQLYVNGKLIGGLDIVKEMNEDGSLKECIPDEAKGKLDTLNGRLEQLINSAPVILFMKGSPSAPQCGFSNKIIKLLDSAGIMYKTFDILSDQSVREGLKVYSKWPTYPQLYISGKLIGGLDIVTEMHNEGELLSAVPESAKKKLDIVT